MILFTGRLYNSKGEPDKVFGVQRNPEVDPLGQVLVDLRKENDNTVLDVQTIELRSVTAWLLARCDW